MQAHIHMYTYARRHTFYLSHTLSRKDKEDNSSRQETSQDCLIVIRESDKARTLRISQPSDSRKQRNSKDSLSLWRAD